MKIYKHIIAAIAVVAVAGMAFDASGADAISPYSRFGYGLLNSNATSAQRQMGGVGYAMNSGRQINVMNPASYANCDSLTFLFDMGLDFTALKSKENGIRDTQYGGGLEYVTMQFPLGKYMGASLGMLPYSSVGYAFGSEIKNGTSSRQGYGGINQAYLGLSGRPFKGFTIGFNLSYMFGNNVNDAYVYSDATGGSTSLFEQVFEIRDWHIEIGAQYTVKLNDRNKLSAGLVYSPAKTLLGKSWVVKYDITSSEAPDTVAKAEMKGNYSLPETWGAGLSWRFDDRLELEADFTYQPWSKVKFKSADNFIDTRFADRWQAGLGAQFTPNPRGGYLSRVAYRLGGYYNRDYMNVRSYGIDNKVRDIGVTLGFGLPVISSKTMVNVGFEWRNRRAFPNALLTENYFNITVGINFNELWFFQNKIR